MQGGRSYFCIWTRQWWSLCSFSVPVGNNIFLLVGPVGLVCALDMFIFLSVSQQVPTAKCAQRKFSAVLTWESLPWQRTQIPPGATAEAALYWWGTLHTCTPDSSRLPALADIFILFTLILIVLPLFLSGPGDTLYLEFIFRASVHLMKTSSCSVGKRCFNFVLSYVLNERASSSCNFTIIFNLLDPWRQLPSIEEGVNNN